MFALHGHGSSKYKNEAFWQLLVPPALRWLGKRLWNVLLHSDGFLIMDTEYFRSVLRHDIGPVTFQEASWFCCGLAASASASEAM